MNAAPENRLAASARFEHDGFEILPAILPLDQCDLLAEELSLLHQLGRTKNGKRGGLRNILRDMPMVSRLASSERITNFLTSCLSGSESQLFPVRALFFDKTPEANWSVAWHQDLTIAVAEKIETPGFSAWTVKEGVVHAQAPEGILKRMVTVRLHLDAAMSDNGALAVVPGSHNRGKLQDSDISVDQCRDNAFLCEVPKGAALMMRPLLLHSSAPAKNPSHRRVLHIEYATTDLPDGLRWANT